MRITATLKTDTLQVPGAKLHYEVRGSGPVLLMMPGGPADATTFRKIENDLAERYTVVTYDPRDLSHSTVDEPTDDARMVRIYADDVHRLLRKVAGDTKACVFASSGGATIALELATQHPEQLATVICHEPPSPYLVANTAETLAGMEAVCDTCASEGLFPAMQKFMTLVGIEGGPQQAPPQHEPTPQELEAMAMMQKNFAYFFGRYIRNVARYEPDFDALRSCPCAIVAAVGADSKGQLAHNGGLGLAARLGSKPVVFPGDHGGFDGRSSEFSAKLLEVLGRAR